MEDQIAQALVACRVKVVACGTAEADNPRNGVALSLLSTLCLKALPLASGAHSRLLVATARPELQQVVLQLAGQGCAIELAAPADISPPEGCEARVYSWPALYTRRGSEPPPSEPGLVAEPELVTL